MKLTNENILNLARIDGCSSTFRELLSQFLSDKDKERPISMDESIIQAYRTGGLIPAIKLHRSITNAGLADSKGYVERLATRCGLR